jgi:23S rRNA (pseudouridine1915-N3)-methyltransferase
MQVQIVAFGKLKTPGLREAVDYYLKLLGTWTQARELELKPIAVPDKYPATRKLIQEKEGKLLLSKLEDSLSARGVLVLLDETGKNLPTHDWAKQLQKLQDDGVREVSFCIGSSLGFSTEVRSRARLTLSFGSQTLSHELARSVLCEQLYRAWSVNKGHPYHNEGV